jgi:hypothetical protein
MQKTQQVTLSAIILTDNVHKTQVYFVFLGLHYFNFCMGAEECFIDRKVSKFGLNENRNAKSR